MKPYLFLKIQLNAMRQPQVYVVDELGARKGAFALLCEALRDDVESAQGTGRDFLEGVSLIEEKRAKRVRAGGHAWNTYMSPEQVWFEKRCVERRGGVVTLAQYKLALMTYLEFLTDPNHVARTIPFPYN